MDPATLTQLIPLGGVSVILLYLVGTLVADRIAARREHTDLVQRHSIELGTMRAQCRQDIAEATADLIDQTTRQRARISELEQEVNRLRNLRGIG